MFLSHSGPIGQFALYPSPLRCPCIWNKAHLYPQPSALPTGHTLCPSLFLTQLCQERGSPGSVSVSVQRLWSWTENSQHSQGIFLGVTLQLDVIVTRKYCFPILHSQCWCGYPFSKIWERGNELEREFTLNYHMLSTCIVLYHQL